MKKILCVQNTICMCDTIAKIAKLSIKRLIYWYNLFVQYNIENDATLIPFWLMYWGCINIHQFYCLEV